MIRSSCALGLGRTPASYHSLKSRTTNVFGNTTHIKPTPTIAKVTRRWNASSPPNGPNPPANTKAISGLSSHWLEPIIAPFRRYGNYQRKSPYMAQTLSALVIYFIGDVVAQSIGPAKVADEEEQRGWLQKWAGDRDWARTGRALVIGGLAAIPGYRWFLWLGNSFNYSSKVLSLVTKVSVNQLVFTPIFNSYFFGMQSFLSGATYAEILERIKNTVPISWINSCKIWPAVTAFMFTFIPLEYRNIFGGVIAIGWQTYLSLLNQRAAAKEELEQAKATGTVQPLVRTEEVEREAGVEKCAA